MHLKNIRTSAILLIVAGSLFTLFSCDSQERRIQPDEESLPATAISNEDLVSRGKYLPWPSYGQLDDKDLSAIFAFLKSTKPVRNVVPAPIPPDKL